MLDSVSAEFQAFAATCHESSPLYERLAVGIAKDPEVLTLAAQARKGERAPNILFAAVQFLLLKRFPHPLAEFYEPGGTSPDNAYPNFRAFCLEHAAAIRELISTRRVQTNEVARSALLLPVFVRVSHEAQGRPLYLLEVGTSAGLNLLWDRYGYNYGNGLKTGDRNSAVQLKCSLRGTVTPPVPATLPDVYRRIGVDLNPIDVDDPEATLWLRALVWPGNPQRVRLLENALAVAREEKPEIVGGDGVALLPELLADVPREAALCIFRVFTNLPPEARAQLSASIAQHGARRDLWVLSTRRGARPVESTLGLVSYRNGVKSEALLANCENHGGWIEWLVDG